MFFRVINIDVKRAFSAEKVIYLTALLGYSVAALLFLFSPRIILLPKYWVQQVLVLLIIDCGLSMILYRIKNSVGIVCILLLEYTILLLISYPESDDLQIATVLMFVLISESNFKLKGFSGFFLSLIFIGVFVTSRPSEPIWSSNFFTPSAKDMIAFCFFSLFTSSTTTFLHMYQSIAVREMQTIKQLENNIHKLTNVNIDFQDYAAAIGFQSIENERKRISREIHDTIGYSLTNIIMMMEAASDITPQNSEKLSSLIEITRTQAQMSLQETRRALRELRINEQEQISGQKAINKLIRIFEKVTGVEVSIEYGNIPLMLPDEVNSFMYRMIQEGLTNAFKHGKATRISIYFWMTEKKILYIHVRDNGIGDQGEIFEGIGIAGMKERAEKLHGKVEARYVFDGFQLFAEIPLNLNC